jgi:ABC-type nickel/cobalt efflux system permease component RcnA
MTRSLAALCALLLSLVAAFGAFAQDAPQKSPFGVPLAPGQSTAVAPGQKVERSFLGDLWSYVLTQQQRINRELAGAVRQLKTGNVLDATLLLAFLSFTYGVLHAAGPGHGKAVISSYVLANEKTVKRGIMLSFLSAFFQALSAIAIVGVLAIALNATSLQITATEKWIETISWGFVALIGIWLLYGQLGALFKRRRAESIAAVSHDHATGRHDAHAQSHGSEHTCGCGHDHGHDHAHHHHHAHAKPDAPAHEPHVHAEDGSCCGHAHMPDPKQLEGPMSWSKAIAIALSVGIRPCTGAILVLIFAMSQGLLIAGIFATFAMALGTAITVSILASLAVGSRELATRMAGGESRFAGAVATGAGLLGSTLVFLMGAAFFVASLQGGMTAPL